MELGLTNTAARGAVSVGSAARPLAVANVELVLKDLGDTKVNSCSFLSFCVENQYPHVELRLKFIRILWVSTELQPLFIPLQILF